MTFGWGQGLVLSETSSEQCTYPLHWLSSDIFNISSKALDYDSLLEKELNGLLMKVKDMIKYAYMQKH